MKITVTTPTGNIGRVLTEKLLGGDAEITLIARSAEKLPVSPSAAPASSRLTGGCRSHPAGHRTRRHSVLADARWPHRGGFSCLSKLAWRRGKGGRSFSGPDYLVIKGDFVPPPIGWRFWRAFQYPGKRLANFRADLVFDEPNDLVVNTASMSQLSDKLEITDGGHVHEFGETSTVDHANSFEQPETVAALLRWLAMS